MKKNYGSRFIAEYSPWTGKPCVYDRVYRLAEPYSRTYFDTIEEARRAAHELNKKEGS